MIYNGFYIYKGDKEPIVINNDGKMLSFEMYGVQFSGPEFSDFSVWEEVSDSIKDRCEFTEVSILNKDITELTLCNCSFEVYIPQIVVNIATSEELCIIMNINYILGGERPEPKGGLDKDEVTLSMQLDEAIYMGKGDFFEMAFDKLYSQLQGKYYLKNCYGCLYSDYSIYGQTSFGGMQCHVENKENYLSVVDKVDFSNLENFVYVQEIYLCDKYQRRIKGTGYRG